MIKTVTLKKRGSMPQTNDTSGKNKRLVGATLLGLALGLAMLGARKHRKAVKTKNQANKTVKGMQKRVDQSKRVLEAEGESTWEELKQLVAKELDTSEVRGEVAKPHISKAVDTVVKHVKDHFDLSRSDAKALATELKKDWKAIKKTLASDKG